MGSCSFYIITYKKKNSASSDIIQANLAALGHEYYSELTWEK
jgi:hypothetical protein